MDMKVFVYVEYKNRWKEKKQLLSLHPVDLFLSLTDSLNPFLRA